MKSLFENITSTLWLILVWVLGILGVLSPIYAVIIDVKADRIFWGVLDILMPPVGIIRGICLFFGWL